MDSCFKRIKRVCVLVCVCFFAVLLSVAAYADIAAPPFPFSGDPDSIKWILLGLLVLHILLTVTVVIVVLVLHRRGKGPKR